MTLLSCKYVIKIVCFQAALDKQAESLLISGARFDDFLNRAEAWWMSKSEKCIAMFEIFDASQEDIVSYDEFKAGKKM